MAAMTELETARDRAKRAMRVAGDLAGLAGRMVDITARMEERAVVAEADAAVRKARVEAVMASAREALAELGDEDDTHTSDYWVGRLEHLLTRLLTVLDEEIVKDGP